MVEIVGSGIIKSADKNNILKNNINDSIYDSFLDMNAKIKLIDMGKYKEIKKLDDTVDGMLVNGKIKEKYVNEIDDFYLKNDIDAKYLSYAKGIIVNHCKIDSDGKTLITNKDLVEIIQLIKGDRFLVKAISLNNKIDKYVHFEIKDISKNNINIFNKIDGNLIVARHIDDDVDLDGMTDYLLEGMGVVNSIDKYKDIKFIYSCSWLNDKDFLDFWSAKREGRSSKIINLFNREEKYGEYLGTEGDGNLSKIPFWYNRIDENSDLGRIVEEYESRGNKLKEGKRLISLELLKKYKK